MITGITPQLPSPKGGGIFFILILILTITLILVYLYFQSKEEYTQTASDEIKNQKSSVDDEPIKK